MESLSDWPGRCCWQLPWRAKRLVPSSAPYRRAVPSGLRALGNPRRSSRHSIPSWTFDGSIRSRWRSGAGACAGAIAEHDFAWECTALATTRTAVEMAAAAAYAEMGQHSPRAAEAARRLWS